MVSQKMSDLLIIRLTPDLHTAIKSASIQQGVSAFIRGLVIEHLRDREDIDSLNIPFALRMCIGAPRRGQKKRSRNKSILNSGNSGEKRKSIPPVWGGRD